MVIWPLVYARQPNSVIPTATFWNGCCYDSHIPCKEAETQRVSKTCSSIEASGREWTHYLIGLFYRVRVIVYTHRYVHVFSLLLKLIVGFKYVSLLLRLTLFFSSLTCTLWEHEPRDKDLIKRMHRANKCHTLLLPRVYPRFLGITWPVVLTFCQQTAKALPYSKFLRSVFLETASVSG